ncbi:MAG: hypothetical protein R3185_00005, partial [Candidatus Thermoplasmatota archaeon]|nr:hypothetical protein [Candidatus Thermoplasmatota archaeon]
MVGFILITAIALISVTVVLLGGQPTLERLQAGQESEAMIGYMGDLEQEVTGLITGSPASTTPAWRVAMASGSLHLDQEGHIWGFTVDLTTNSLEWDSLHDGDNQVSFSPDTPL